MAEKKTNTNTSKQTIATILTTNDEFTLTPSIFHEDFIKMISNNNLTIHTDMKTCVMKNIEDQLKKNTEVNKWSENESTI